MYTAPPGGFRNLTVEMASLTRPGDRSMTRYRHDTSKMVENNEISTGVGRWALETPNVYGNAVFVPDVTIRMQRWGAAHDMTSTKTDVESDLRNLGRPTTRTVCGQYDPSQGQGTLTPMPEAEFPQAHARLFDPPCTLRGSGFNRWEWLCQDPQENVMIPFEWAVDSRHAAKDDYDMPNCGPKGRDASLPVARPQVNPTNVIPGSAAPSLSVGVPPYREAPRGLAPPAGKSNPLAPPMGAPSVPSERTRAVTGVQSAPPFFGSSGSSGSGR